MDLKTDYLKTDVASRTEIMTYLSNSVADREQSEVHKKIISLQQTTNDLTTRAEKISAKINSPAFQLSQLRNTVTDAFSQFSALTSAALTTTITLFSNFNHIKDMKAEINHTLMELKRVERDITTFQKTVSTMLQERDNSSKNQVETTLLTTLAEKLNDCNRAVTQAKGSLTYTKDFLTNKTASMKDAIAEQTTYGTFTK